MTNFNDVRASLIDGTKDITVAAITGSSVAITAQVATTVATFNASKQLVSSTVTPTELLLLSGLTSVKNITNYRNTAWTPTGSWSTNTTYTGSYRRVGDVVQCIVYITLAGAPTAAGLTINLPASHTIDTTKLLSTTNGFVLGSCTTFCSASFFSGFVTYSSTTAVEIDAQVINVFTGNSYTRFTQMTQVIPGTFANTNWISIKFEVPIVEYA